MPQYEVPEPITPEQAEANLDRIRELHDNGVHTECPAYCREYWGEPS